MTIATDSKAAFDSLINKQFGAGAASALWEQALRVIRSTLSAPSLLTSAAKSSGAQQGRFELVRFDLHLSEVRALLDLQPMSPMLIPGTSVASRHPSDVDAAPPGSGDFSA